MLTLNALKRPMAPISAAAAGSAIMAGVALYCSAYSALAGRPESPVEGLLWAAVNVLPWFAAFELGKRQGVSAPAALGGALLLSVGLHLLFWGIPDNFWFEVARRLPGAVAAAALIALVKVRSATAGPAPELPLLPHQIHWVSAAGNYVELHVGQRTFVHRASLSSVEGLLRRHGFVRIHRSILVRLDCVARVRAVDVLLNDGTSLKLGNRYRSAVAAAAEDFRPFVPAE